ncbi:hypothetical protein T265_05326 [Opisthorchis viverrini]|uniref:Neurofascin/L1/NrCAM C-terminal domain-containing protein n=1 Tax=Opisthorchis viverrini TaxID=6198 RepID=A0A075AFG3_OPIVI|nr:hypothetical protein T265_05326 [Opisthorchis viverrini]KER27699.1 hypothetical protein T265_05326 [Opisthorchis viverrini]
MLPCDLFFVLTLFSASTLNGPLVESSSVQSVRFVPVRDARQEPVIHLTNSITFVTLDASSPISRTVYFAKRSMYIEQSFVFACLVNPQTTPLKGIALCCRKNRNAADLHCPRVPEGKPHGTITCAGTEFSYDSSEFTGANFSIHIREKQQFKDPMDGLFRCHVTDSSKTTIISNEIEIRDAVYYIRQLQTRPSNSITVIPPIFHSEFPRPFYCVDDTSREWPVWMSTLSDDVGTILWGYCEILVPMNAHTCLQVHKALPKAVATAYVNGTMFLTDPSFLSKREVAIVCRDEDVRAPVRTFAGGQIDHSSMITNGLSVDTTSDYVQKLQPLTELYQNFTFIYGGLPKGFSLNALYRESEAGCSFQWSKDGADVPLSGASKFSYQLPLVDELLLGGTYKLTVVSKSDESDKLIFTFVVNVVRPPEFTDIRCLPRLFYVMKGNNFTTLCPFISRPQPRAFVGVNHLEAATAVELRRMLEKEAILNKKLSQLDIDFGVENIAEPPEVTITVNSLQSEQDFDLSVRLTSPFGGSRIFSSLKVVPVPKLMASPVESSCEEDCDNVPFNVSCSLDPDLVQQWRQLFDVTASLTWVVQNQWSSDKWDPDGIGRFFSVPILDGSVLSVWPQGYPLSTQNAATNSTQMGDSTTFKSLKEFIRENAAAEGSGNVFVLSLRCRVQLFVHNNEPSFAPPPGPKMRRGLRQQHPLSRDFSPTAPRLLYDSSWEPDTTLVSQLIALRSFSPDPQPATANLTWIVAVVIALLVVFVVIGLGIWLYTRDRGETYMLYDKERAHGNDPIQEMKETEGFKTYQRQEEQPIASSRYSINDESMHVGSDEDGELDQYEDNFNEEGSFIHGYSTDPALARFPRNPSSPPDVSILQSGQNDTSV